jgi:hypothetical protein
MVDQKPARPLVFFNRQDSPEIFADAAIGFSHLDGAVKVTLMSNRVNHKSDAGEIHQVVVGYVVMTTEGAKNLAIGLFDFLKSNGIDPTSGEKPN